MRWGWAAVSAALLGACSDEEWIYRPRDGGRARMDAGVAGSDGAVGDRGVMGDAGDAGEVSFQRVRCWRFDDRIVAKQRAERGGIVVSGS